MKHQTITAVIAVQLLIFWVLALFPTPLSAASPGRDPSVYFFNMSFGNLQEELATARQDGKLGLFIMFGNDDCPWCKKMKSKVFSQPKVQKYYRKYFRILEVDTEGDTPITDFSGHEMSAKNFAFKEFRVRATPVFIFFDLHGKPVMRYTGATRGVKDFMLLGKFVAEGHYKNQTFIAYKRKQLAAEGGSE
ncbi:disulfide bond reductase DsbH precursor [bacterium BMS3Bbin14]|nr:disulfide bond reductase DsbH precursor [bacterium BMS3Abin13]GBE51912.1 disulfide bond reductase DsbH precursor [bacterium BMS3Bbin14]